MTQATLTKTDPEAARRAWLEATETKKICDLRHKKAQEQVAVEERRIRNATTNGTLTPGGRVALADLGEALSRAMGRLEDEAAARGVAAKAVREAWNVWEPHARHEAGESPAPVIPRVQTQAASAKATKKAERQQLREAAQQRAKELPYYCLYGGCQERFKTSAGRDAHMPDCPRARGKLKAGADPAVVAKAVTAKPLAGLQALKAAAHKTIFKPRKGAKA